MVPSEMSQIGADAPNQAGQFGKWDMYPMMVQEAGRLADRRQIANTLFLSINSLLVGAIAVLAQQSGFASVSLLIVQVMIAAAGFLLSRQWLKLLELYRRLLDFRYAKLAQIEAMPGFPGALPVYTLESREGGDKDTQMFGFGAVEEFIPKLFRVLYVIGTLLLIAGTIAVKIRFGAWLSHHISIPPLQ
jgi:hypothetical protein